MCDVRDGVKIGDPTKLRHRFGKYTWRSENIFHPDQWRQSRTFDDDSALGRPIIYLSDILSDVRLGEVVVKILVRFCISIYNCCKTKSNNGIFNVTTSLVIFKTFSPFKISNSCTWNFRNVIGKIWRIHKTYFFFFFCYLYAPTLYHKLITIPI